MTLVEFLLARIAEDEARVEGMSSGADPDFFWGPDRIRAECEAKRAIVQTAINAYEAAEERGDPFEGGFAAGYTDCLQALALPYADHPDYDREWWA